MISPVMAIRDVLLGNIVLDEKVIPVKKRSYPYDKTPCITIDDSGGSAFLERYILNIDCVLPKSHPQYDEDNPNRKFPQQVLREVYQTTVNINVWCDTEMDREVLNNQVSLLFYKAQSDYYLFCDNYDRGICKNYEGECRVLIKDELFDNRIIKGQCPEPDVYGYCNIFDKYNLIRSSFFVEQPFSLDDLSKSEPVLRSVFKVNTGYFVDHIIGGNVIQDFVVDVDV